MYLMQIPEVIQIPDLTPIPEVIQIPDLMQKKQFL